MPFLEQRGLAAGVDLNEAADFLARMVLSYMSAPGRWDLDDPVQVAQLVRSELLAGVVVRTPVRDAAGCRTGGPPADRFVDNETNTDLTFHCADPGGVRSEWCRQGKPARTATGRPRTACSATRSPAPSRVGPTGPGRPAPGPDHRRHPGLPGPARHGQDHRGRHRPAGRGVPGHRVPGVPRRPGRDAGRGGRHRDGPAVLRPRGAPGRGRRPRPRRWSAASSRPPPASAATQPWPTWWSTSPRWSSGTWPSTSRTAC